MGNAFQSYDNTSMNSDSELEISVWGSKILLKIGITKVTLSSWWIQEQMSMQTLHASFFTEFFQPNSKTTSDILDKISENKDSRNKVKENVNVILKKLWFKLSGNEIISINESLSFPDIVKQKVIYTLQSAVHIEWMLVKYIQEEDVLLIDDQEVRLTPTQLDIFLYFASKLNKKEYPLQNTYSIWGFRVHIDKINKALESVELKLALDEKNDIDTFPYGFTKI